MKTPILTALAALLTALVLPAAEDARPNILFILADDQRNDELGCAGDAHIKTPNIDRLAARGVRFANMFVTTSICAASRASIFTGLTERSHGYTFEKPPVCLDDVATSYPALLKKAGYRTGFFGKFGVSLEGGKRSRAHTQMFDRYHSLHRSPYFKKQPDGTLRHVDEVVGDRAVAFLESQPEDQPFCLSLSFNIAHAEDGDKRPGSGHFPWPKAVDGQYEEGDMPLPRLRDPAIFNAMPEFLRKSLNRSRYFWRWDTPEKYDANMRARFRMLTGMDGIVGRVLQTLEQRGLADNTVVIYTADNGYYRGERGFAGKWSHFEESLRVPLIIYDPRLPSEKRGRSIDAMALNIDLPATMVDLAGVDIPEKYQGRSLRPFVDGSTPAAWRKDFFCEHLMEFNPIPMWEGVRDTRYMYARYFGQKPAHEFLHDLQKDPDELENLVGDGGYAAVLDEMRARCEAYVKQYSRPGQPRPQPRPRRGRGARRSVKPNEEGLYRFDGKKRAEGDVPFALPAMPCYLGGDPNAAETARCEIRNANTAPGEVAARVGCRAPTKPLAERVQEADKVFVGVLINRKLLKGDWCHADLKVTRAIKGVRAGEPVPVLWRPGIAHYDAREGQKGLAVLKPAHGDRYWLRSDTFEDAALAEQAVKLLGVDRK